MKIIKVSGEPGSQGWINTDRGNEDPSTRGVFSCPNCGAVNKVVNPRGDIDCSNCQHSWSPE